MWRRVNQWALVLTGAGLYCLAPLASAQTNAPAAPAAAAQQVWDYAAQLKLTPTQQATLDEIRTAFENARAAVRNLSTNDVPPDARRAAQLHFNDQFRLTNRRIAELLNEEQKREFVKLRAAGRKTRSAGANTNAAPALAETPTPAAEAAEAEDAPALPLSRKPPRAKLTNEEYAKLATELRATYSQPTAEWPAPTLDEDVKPYYVELGLLPLVNFPTNNPYSDAKAELGKRLFFDPRLSGSSQISCANCHDPDLAFADGRTVSFGHERKELKRNAPTILNTAFNETLFWDGRTGTLEQQVMDVVNNADEMRGSGEQVRDRLQRMPDYTNEFATVFGSPDITLPRVAQAIATFERTITSRGNAFDSFLRGDTNALSDAAVRGLHLFRTTARCVNCHHGPNFTDGRFHNEGLTYYGRKLEDLGRYGVTKEPKDVGAFKTPTLRNITRTAPYMHNGLFDLDGVLNMYNAGMATVRRRPDQKDDPLFPTKSPHLQSLGLNANDQADLKAFLEALTETRQRMRPPELPQEGKLAKTVPLP